MTALLLGIWMLTLAMCGLFFLASDMVLLDISHFPITQVSIIEHHVFCILHQTIEWTFGSRQTLVATSVDVVVVVVICVERLYSKRSGHSLRIIHSGW